MAEQAKTPDDALTQQNQPEKASPDGTSTQPDKPEEAWRGFCATLDKLVAELALLRNLPAVRHGQEWQETIPMLEQEMARILQRLSAQEANARARVLNNTLVTSGNDVLEPLHSVLNGAPIPGFPKTPKEINELDESGLDAILTHLGLPTYADIALKRLLIRRSCGVIPEALPLRTMV